MHYSLYLLDSDLPEIEIIREIVHQEALLYVTGYVAYRFRSKYPNLGIPTKEMPCIDPPNWLCHLSRGSLIYPSNELIENA